MFNKPLRQLLVKEVQMWKESALFALIDKIISEQSQRKLKNDHFTILCSNCVGGVLYHRLGKQFLSPTINMWFRQNDFIEFCIHLNWYLKQPLNFVDKEGFDYPVAELSGNNIDIPTITLFFNHDTDPKKADDKWTERKSRIVWDNLYIMLYNLDGVSVEQISKLDNVPCKNKVVFTSKPLPEITWSYYIKPIMSHKYPCNYLEKDIFGVRYLEKKFDYVAFFNDVPVSEMKR